ncbi:MAG: SLBB domain-containing protein [Spirochaetota bacterium]
MKRIVSGLFALLFSIAGAAAQEMPPGETPSPIEAELAAAQMERVRLAISNTDYPITPGDIYELTYYLAGAPVIREMTVTSDYTIDLGIFGRMNVIAMEFPELEQRVEAMIEEAYPKSQPTLTITSVGSFQVPILGQVRETDYISAWGLTRLSEILEGRLTRYASTRDIRIVDYVGRSTRYDFWKAQYQGLLDQDPYVKPGDRVVVPQIKREVTVRGEVFRPGRYQLLEDENIDDVLDFSGGFTPMADLTRLTVERLTAGNSELLVFDYTSQRPPPSFQDRDIITVPSKQFPDQLITVVGAVNNPGRYPYKPPETYHYYVNQAGGFNSELNTQEAVVITDRYGNERDPYLPLMPGDTINVPTNDFVYNFNRHFPMVAGGLAFIITLIEIVTLSNQ